MLHTTYGFSPHLHCDFCPIFSFLLLRRPLSSVWPIQDHLLWAFTNSYRSLALVTMLQNTLRSYKTQNLIPPISLIHWPFCRFQLFSFLKLQMSPPTIRRVGQNQQIEAFLLPPSHQFISCMVIPTASPLTLFFSQCSCCTNRCNPPTIKRAGRNQ